ncbi:hypothetical protein GCM10009623_17340 [Nocardioides aestuarii]|uniref:Major facilitator superfamily (MFS) profile domain-containing protein n=1 Tax=Nocardioides aestuarii TaxID=252231 RepID=A0ABW4TME3_9ACTN
MSEHDPTTGTPDQGTGRHTDPGSTEPVTRSHVVDREREEHGGIKIGSAFFGWLAATGMVALLSGLVAVTGLVASETTGTDTATETADALDVSMESLGVLGIVVALLVWFVAYYSGGYVAGRMARFDGIKQGLAVWGWSIVIAIVIGVLGAVFGNDYTGVAIPDIRFDETTTTVVVSVAVVLLTSLVGAMLGGLAGMRFHRRVDRTGLGA